MPGTAASTALAIELTLSVPQPPWSRQTRPDPLPQLLARLVRPGKNGWVAGGLSWSQLGHLHYSGEYRAPHVRWLREFYALYKSGGQHSAYSSYGEEKTITLSAFESTRLWPLLDEAAAIGLQLVRGGQLGPLESYQSARILPGHHPATRARWSSPRYCASAGLPAAVAPSGSSAPRATASSTPTGPRPAQQPTG